MPIATGTTTYENVQATDLMPPVKTGNVSWVGPPKAGQPSPLFTPGHDGKAGSQCYFQGNDRRGKK